LERLATLAGFRHVAIAAFCHYDKPGNGVGVARAIQSTESSPAELAVTISDEVQGNGIGELLLRMVVMMMHQHGVTSFTASTMTDNTAAKRVFQRLGATLAVDLEDVSVTQVELSHQDVVRTCPWTTVVNEQIQSFVQAAAGAPMYASVDRAN
jgi:RimJ/RimL family protein N-acetyltransferase